MATFVKAPCDEGVIRSAPDTAPSPAHVGLWVLVATILGSSMALIDGSVVNVALPVIQRDFNTTAANVQWVVDAYSLFLAALILVGGHSVITSGEGASLPLAWSSSSLHQSPAVSRQTCCS